MHNHPIRVPAPDGIDVPLYWFAAKQPLANLLFMPALGMQARYYLPFAEAMAAAGFNTLLMEQRGHGHSPLRASRHVDFGIAEWLEYDIPTALAWLHQQAPGQPNILGGHSLGGHIAASYAGINPNNADALMLVACATPHARNFAPKTALQIRLMTSLIIPASARLLGYYPGDWIGFGGREARTLMHDWRDLALSNRYGARGLDVDIDAGVRAWSKPVLQVRFADDPFGPAAATDTVTERMTQAPVTKVVLDAATLGTRADHFRWARQPAAVAAAARTWWLA